MELWASDPPSERVVYRKLETLEAIVKSPKIVAQSLLGLS